MGRYAPSRKSIPLLWAAIVCGIAGCGPVPEDRKPESGRTDIALPDTLGSDAHAYTLRHRQKPARAIPPRVISPVQKDAANWSLDLPVTYPRPPGTGPYPGPTAVADVTGDGRNDVLGLFVTGSIWSLVVYPQTSTGSLGPSVAYEVDGYSSPWDGGIATGDLDGDGLFEAVVTSSRSLSVFYFERGGGATRVVLNPANRGWSKVAIVDVDRDGRNDIFALSNQQVDAATNRSGGAFLNRGQRNFIGPAGFMISNRFKFELEVADVTGDGKPDAVSISELVARMTVHRAGLESFASWDDYTHPNLGAIYVATGVGDFNGDGRREVATAYSLANNLSRVVVFRQLSYNEGRQVISAELMAPQYTGALVGGDIDNDGDDDLLLVPQPRNEPLRLYLQHEGVLPTDPMSIIGTTGQDQMNTDSAVMADVNSDGCRDIVIASGMQGVVVWYGRNCIRRRISGGNQRPGRQ